MSNAEGSEKRLRQINAVSDELFCRFVLVLVLVLEAFEPLSIEDEYEHEDEYD